MVKKVITNLDFSKAPGPDCIPVVVLKNCEPEYVTLNMCLKESCFPDCWKVSLVVPVFKNVGESSTSKTTTSLKNLYIGLLITTRNVAFFLIFNMVLGLLDQLQIF